jgi:WD40-like Beta Propeller Repeat
MTDHDDFHRMLAGWFEADALSPAPTGGLDRVFDATRRSRPRPAWLAGPGSHWVGDGQTAESSTGDRYLRRLGLSWCTALILLLVLAALAGGAILVGAQLLHRSSVPAGRLGQLVYGLDGDMYVANWDGTNPVRIADGASGLGPTACGSDGGEGRIWSPDGQHLAYRSASGDGCAATVVIADPTTKAVVSFPGDGWAVSWSPDSTRIATWIDVFNTIGIYGVDGVRQALLTVPAGCAEGGDYDPVWSSDGRSLIGRACEVPIDSRPPQTLPSTDPRSHEWWAYSPDGARVAYVSLGSLVDAAVDGSQDRVLVTSGVTEPVFRPVWSPTGDRIAFAGAPPEGPDGILANEISVVDVTSGTVTLLASASGTGTVQLIGFSPDGDLILFSRTDAGNTSSLWSVHADGSDPQLLVSGADWGDWQWLPPGP